MSVGSYANARFYDPKIGRFITADPTIQRPHDPQDFNRYAYARNNPIRFIDPTGFGFWSWLKGLFGSSGSSAGAGIGSVIGAIIGSFIPGGTLAGAQIGGMIGGGVGGGIQSSLNGGSGFQIVLGALMGAQQGYAVGSSVGGFAQGFASSGGVGAGGDLPANAGVVNADNRAIDNISTTQSIPDFISAAPSKTGAILNSIFGFTLAYAATTNTPSSPSTGSFFRNFSVEATATAGIISYQSPLHLENFPLSGLTGSVAGGIGEGSFYGTLPPQFGAGLEVGLFPPDSEEVLASPYFGFGKHFSVGTNIVQSKQLFQGLNVNIGRSTSNSPISVDIPISRISQGIKQAKRAWKN